MEHRGKDLIAYSNYRLDRLPQPKENADYKTAQIVRVAGMITSVKKLTSKTRKEQYARFNIEDMYGSIDVVLFPKNFDKFNRYLTVSNVVVVNGGLTGAQGQSEIIAEDVMTIDEAKEKFQPNCGEIHIKLSTARYNDALGEDLKKIFDMHRGKQKFI